jgi:hypothetical protein
VINPNPINHYGSWRVIHLSTGHAGGAGLAARRLNAGLNEIGVNSKFLALSKKSFKPQTNELGIKRNLFRIILSVLTLRLQKNFSRKIMFSSWSSNAMSFKYFHSLSKNANTILHFHNWTNLISEKNLLQLSSSGVKVILTAHDERIMTGGCHYKFDCLKLNAGCTQCPQVKYRWQKRIIQSTKHKKDRVLKQVKNQPIVIAPSSWIASEIRSGSAYESNKIVKISNFLGSEWAKESHIQKKVGPKKTYLVGVASMSNDSYAKAGDVVKSLINSEEVSKNSFKFVFLNEIESENAFPVFWKKIDTLLALSRADNSPNVIWEAFSLGIPVISVKVGGIPEIANTDQMMLFNQPEDALSAFIDSEGLCIKQFIDSYDFNVERVEKMESHDIISIKNHVDLYLKVLNQEFSGDNK